MAVGSLLLVGLLQQAAAEVPQTLVHRTVHQACAWRSSAATSTAAGPGLGVTLVGAVMIGALAVGAAVAWGPRTAATTPATSEREPVAVDPYARSSWRVDPGLPWALTTIDIDGQEHRAIRLGPPNGGAATAHLALSEHLPRSFRFSYRFTSADSADGLARQAAGAWMHRELTYRLLPDASGYAVAIRLNGKREEWRDTLDFAIGDPFTFAVGQRVWLLVRDLEVEFLPD